MQFCRNAAALPSVRYQNTKRMLKVLPLYRVSSFSSFLSLTLTSVGRSCGAGDGSSGRDLSFGASPLLGSSEVSSAVFFVALSDLVAVGLGVPERLGISESSMTNSGSNSEGSGPFPEASPCWRLGATCRRVR